MSKLEQKLAGDGLVITGELPVVDGGGIEAVRQKLEQYEPWVDAVNATDNTPRTRTPPTSPWRSRS